MFATRLAVGFTAVLLLAVPSGAGASTSEHESRRVRVATFNVSLFRNSQGQLVDELERPRAEDVNIEQIHNIAEIIQRQRPDILLLNEFDYDSRGRAVNLFQRNFLSIGHNGARPIRYPYRISLPSNTGTPSGHDLNNDGVVGESGPELAEDSYGFGEFRGQYAFAVLSRYPILESEVRTFQFFRWIDMPGALLPDDPRTPEPADWYSPSELSVFRLSSKNHADVPIRVGRHIIHLLASHPTPPTFDGEEDRNGRRNHDEIRFWADYVRPQRSHFIYDDDGGSGGLPRGARFVIAGDLNADPLDGDSVPGAIQQLLEHPLVNSRPAPRSTGAVEAARLQGAMNAPHRGNPAFDTADFNDESVGNLRVDYVLPRQSMKITKATVFWVPIEHPLFYLIGTFDPALPNGFPASDHRLVRIDVRL